MLSIRRIIAGAAGTMVGLMGVGVAIGYINAMLATAPSLGTLARLSGTPQLAAALLDIGRKTMLQIFSLLGADSDLMREFRGKLSSLLNR